MKLIDFASEPEWLRQFLEFPQSRYASDPHWLPDPFEARFQTETQQASAVWRNFLLLDGPQVCGRVTAMINPRLLDTSGRPYGQLGFFECVDDEHTAGLLLEPALDWLRDRVPGGTVLGPMNFDTWHSYRLRIGGFDQPTFLMEPYNPPSYRALFSALGFKPVSQYVTKTVTQPAALMSKWKHHHDAVLERGFRFRSIDPAALESEFELIYRLSLDAFRDNLFFTPISESEFRALYAVSASQLDPDFFVFLLDPDGSPVGLSFSAPDPLVSGTVNLKTFGLLPHARGQGAGAALAYEAYRYFMHRGFTSVNHCLMRLGNRADGSTAASGRSPASTRFTLVRSKYEYLHVPRHGDRA